MPKSTAKKKQSKKKTSAAAPERDAVIKIRGAREHNLKNIRVDIPRNKLVVITGLSGSGKSSLAFDTIYAEGQRRYLESLSSYARQFLEKLKKPEVDYISGLSPSIAIEQRSLSHNPRSTVATITEIYDYLRLLFAKAGRVSGTKQKVAKDFLPEMLCRHLLDEEPSQEVKVYASAVRGRKGEFQKIFETVLKKGYDQALIDGKAVDLSPGMKLKKTQRHDIDILTDHLMIQPANENRLTEAIRAAAELTEGAVHIDFPQKKKKDMDLFAVKLAGQARRSSAHELTPNMFSFNSPYGACPRCKGLGRCSSLKSKDVIVDENKSLMRGALNEEIYFSFNKYFIEDLVCDLGGKYHFESNEPYCDWPEQAQEAFLWGDDELSGLFEELERLFHETSSEQVRRKVRKFLKEETCSVCQGKRLRQESLAVKIQDFSIVDLTEQSVTQASESFGKLEFEPELHVITDPIMKEIKQRLKFLENVGLGYLTLNRRVSTLAGGELQRIRLAAQIGVGLTGVLYVLDEPSIGLHPRDNEKLLNTLEYLRDLKNTVLVVEHDDETMRRADHIIDIGPGAGVHGGQIMAEGHIDDLKVYGKSSTDEYLKGKAKIEIPKKRLDYKKAPKLTLKGCRDHNLKNVSASVPLGLFTCVTGVSGSGKSTLIYDTLYKELHNRIWKTEYEVGSFSSIKGHELIDKVIAIDQAPIGRTPRSNPATYTDVFGLIRKFFAEVRESKARRYTQSRFSFNLKGGRCEDCRGEGFEKLQMSFMPDIYVLCETCRGKRYNDATLEIRYRGKNIAEVLEMNIDEAVDFFSEVSVIQVKLKLLQTIGLGYIQLGQASTTLSGGEAQRIKLAYELSKKATGKTLYLLDEPTTGLHFADIKNLLNALFQLRDQGNTIVVIEHNLDMIKMADYILDLGPEGGQGGGQIVAAGTPEEIAGHAKSHTGKFLRDLL